MHSLGPTVLVTAFGLTSISTIVVAIRFYCRRFIVGAIKPCDYTIFAALLTTWGIAVTDFYQVKYGTGARSNKHMRLTGEELNNNLKAWYAYQIEYLFDLCLIKFSILFFYLGFATERSFRIIIYCFLAIVGVFSITMIFVNAFECGDPRNAFVWKTFYNRHSVCRDLHPIYFSQAGFNIASDIAILVLPMPTLLGLRMNTNKRIAVVSIFSVGFIAVIASIVRVYALYLWTVKKDVAFMSGYIVMWSQIEINTAIITASVPALKPLFKETFSGGTSKGTSAQSSHIKSFPETLHERPPTIGSATTIGAHHARTISAESSVTSTVSASSPESPQSHIYGPTPPYAIDCEHGLARTMSTGNSRPQQHSPEVATHRPSPSGGWEVTRSVTIERSSMMINR